MLEPYEIIFPNIKTGSVFYFKTGSGVDYEVRFARKKKNLLHATIAFGVLNEEYEGEEYVLTNKGEAFRVMATIVTIFNNYKAEHPNINTFEFVGEPTAKEIEKFPQKRLNLYKRYLPNIFDKSWKLKVKGNHVIISKY